MTIEEFPYPQLQKGFILIKNHFSIISPGTEGSTVKTARKSLLGKAKERPAQVQQVLNTLKKSGPIATYRAVTKKLDSFSPLGYSSAGEVIQISEEIENFKVGDLVACAGAGYANHAEVIAVPKNLCVKLNKNANLEHAAYNTVGAIAMQGFRQSELQLGETCVVIGLGLLGQITCLILKASGIKVIGVDIDNIKIDFSKKNNTCDLTINRNNKNINQTIKEYTNGYGADGVIITAASKSKDPINFAGKISRKKAKIVVVGSVPTGFDREPNWYQKELELRMACSYGPGRYDINYEEKGYDYPLAYVRWTENRNMQAFQFLLNSQKIDLSYLTTHTFNFEDAINAYDMILKNDENFLGILLKYNTSIDLIKDNKIINSSIKSNLISKITISFIGAGSYAQSNILPYLKNNKEVTNIGVLTNSSTTSKLVAQKFDFKFCTSNLEDIFSSPTNTVFIVTRHDSHYDFVVRGLKNNMNIFVEKPLCILESELEKIIQLHEKANKVLLVGYNRRFSSLTEKIIKITRNKKVSMIYRVNAGYIPKNTWIQDINIGGGRIIGEICHFVDYLSYVSGSKPISVYSQSMDDNENLNDTLSILIKYENGSIGTIIYCANGSDNLFKEYIEVFSNGISISIKDFKELVVYDGKRAKTTKLFNQDKGQGIMINEFINSLKSSGQSPIPFNEIVSTSKVCFKILESLKNNGKKYNI